MSDDTSKSTVRRRKRYRTASNMMTDEEAEIEKRARTDRMNKQLMVYLVVSVVIVSSWLLGSFGFSFIWIFPLLFATFWLWYKKVTNILETALREKETLLLRRRNLRQSESAEWLNFLLNRW